MINTKQELGLGTKKRDRPSNEEWQQRLTDELNRPIKSVRINKYKKKVFDKGYTPNWTEEVLTANGIQYTNPVTYKLKDLINEEITGSFYEPELLKAVQDVFIIEKVIRRDYKKKLALVKWKGYDDEFNSLIPFGDLKII